MADLLHQLRDAADTTAPAPTTPLSPLSAFERHREETSLQVQSVWKIEDAFRTLKTDLDLRPIFHQLEHRVEAHILVAFLGYCLSVTLRTKLSGSAPGLTAREALASLAAIQMVDVEIPTTDGRVLVLPRYTQPEPEQAMILEKLGLTLPAQPPPRLRAEQVPGTTSSHLSPEPADAAVW